MIWRREDAEGAHVQGSIVPQRPEETMAESSEVTIVGAGARLEGNVISAGSLRIEGQVKGQINAEGDVELAPQSQVEADIRAQNVTVAGKFRGNISVKNKTHLAHGGRVDGNITSKALVIEEGAVFHGQSIMDATAQTGSGKSGSRAESDPAEADAQLQESVPGPVKVP
jgi:cytoskeletal protein CcmA (bactofilin family)